MTDPFLALYCNKQGGQCLSHVGTEGIATLREPFLVVLDKDLRVVSANRSFHETFHVTREETVDQHIYDLGNRQWDIPSLRSLLEELLPNNGDFHDFEVEHD